MIKNLVSVIIPTCNRSSMLKLAVDSIYNQTYKNIEVIIIANGCTDDTAEVVSKLQSEYQGIVFLNYQESLGGAEARNKGLDIAKGEYIAFLDDDDVWIDNKLKMQLEVLKQDKYVIVSCAYNIVYEGSNKQRIIKHKKHIISVDDMLYSNVLGSFSFCVTKMSYIDNLRINKDLKANQDWDLWLKVLIKNNMKGYILDTVLVNYLNHKKKITTNYKNKIEAEKFFLEVWKKLFSKNSIEYRNMNIDFWKMMNGEVKHYISNLHRYFFIIIKSPFVFDFSTYYIYLLRPLKNIIKLIKTNE